MRFATFIVCFYFLFVTTTAYAIGPLLPVVVGGSSILLRGAGVAAGAIVVKNVVPSLGRKATAWCVKNKKCRDTIGDMLEMSLDDDKYSQCQIRFESDDDYVTLDEFIKRKNEKGRNPKPGYDKFVLTEDSKRSLRAQSKNAIRDMLLNPNHYKEWISYSPLVYETEYTKYGIKHRHFVPTISKCSTVIINNDNREEVINNINNRLTQDQREQIVNNYYNENEQEFNNYVNNYCTDNSCNKVSEHVENEIRNGRLDVDNVTTAKCHTENGVILSCDNELELTPPPEKKPKKSCKPRKAKKPTNPDQLDLDFDDEECEEESPEKPPEKPEQKEPPINCNTNKMFREFCEFMDWVDDEADKPGDEKVNVKDKKADEPDDDRIDISQVCPPPENITITVIGHTTTIVFDYKPYCDFAFKTRPYFVSAGGLIAMYILSNRRT